MIFKYIVTRLALNSGLPESSTAGSHFSVSATENYTLLAGNITEIADGDMIRTAASIEKTAETVKLTASGENIEMHSAGDIDNRNKGKIKLF